MNNYKQLITIDEEPQDNVIKCYYDRERKNGLLFSKTIKRHITIITIRLNGWRV